MQVFLKNNIIKHINSVGQSHVPKWHEHISDFACHCFNLHQQIWTDPWTLVFDTVFIVTYIHLGWLMIKQFITCDYLSSNRIEEVYCLEGGNRRVKSLFTSWTGSKRLLDGTFLDNPAASSWFMACIKVLTALPEQNQLQWTNHSKGEESND